MSAREKTVKALFGTPTGMSLADLSENLATALSEFSLSKSSTVECKLRLADLMNCAEGAIPAPDIGLDLLPDEIDAAQRMITLVILATEHDVVTQDGATFRPDQNKRRFADQLIEISLLEDFSSLALQSSYLMQLCISFGSETPDNLNCLEHIEYGVVEKNGKNVAGLKIRNRSILLSQLSAQLETLSLPEKIRSEYPTVTELDWKIATNITSLILCSLENEASKQGQS